MYYYVASSDLGLLISLFTGHPNVSACLNTCCQNRTLLSDMAKVNS